MTISLLNALAAVGADIAINSKKITSMADGSAATDGATRGQLDAMQTFLRWDCTTTLGNSTSARFLNAHGSPTAASALANANKHTAGKTGHLVSFKLNLEASVATDVTFTVQRATIGAPTVFNDLASTFTITAGGTSGSWTGSVAVTDTDILIVKSVSVSADATNSIPRALLGIAA